jgi:phage tail sheath protein FI
VQLTRQVLRTPLGEMSLVERICLLGPGADGPVLLSDVSASADFPTRAASVRRLINVVVQAAQRMGGEFAFEANGEALWSRVRESLSDLLRALTAAGALNNDGVPFTVRCGRDTLRANDLDAGRLIATVELQPAQPITRIVVVLNLRDAGPASALAA